MNQQANLSFLLAILPFRSPFSSSLFTAVHYYVQPHTRTLTQTPHKLKNGACLKSFLGHCVNAFVRIGWLDFREIEKERRE